MRGKFVVFEGIDRSGKSTQAKRLAEWSEGACFMAFPNRSTRIASMIDSYLKSSLNLDDNSVHLLFVANRWECRAEIMDWIMGGKNVVLDRYSYSGVAYSAAKGMDMEWCKGPEKGLPKPDKVFYLDCPPEIARQRAEYGEERYEKFEFQQKVSKAYELILKDLDNVIQIDANQPQDEIFSLILQEFNSIDTTEPLKNLW